MKTVTNDGIEECNKCGTVLVVWRKDESGERVFDGHFSIYPSVCYGYPTQEVPTHAKR